MINFLTLNDAVKLKLTLDIIISMPKKQLSLSSQYKTDITKAELVLHVTYDVQTLYYRPIFLNHSTNTGR